MKTAKDGTLTNETVLSTSDPYNDESKNTEIEFTLDLKECIYDEIQFRIKNHRDKYALDILMAAKNRVKENIGQIKWMLIAMKPFYLMAVIALLSQKPECI